MSSSDPPVSRGLNLWLPLKRLWPEMAGVEDPTLIEHMRDARMRELLVALELARDSTHQRLDSLGFVHYARFLPAHDGRALQVVTEFDGPLQPYVMDFLVTLGDVFALIMAYTEGWHQEGGKPADPRAMPEQFWSFIQAHNRVSVPGAPATGEWRLYRAYPDKTTLDILGPRQGLAPAATDAAVPAGGIDFTDIQANVLKGIPVQRGSHWVYTIADAAAARQLLGQLLPGGSGPLHLAQTSQWMVADARPEVALTLGVTFDGLRALGVAAEDLQPFPQAFQEGPGRFDRAAANGDVGASGPENWVVGSPGQAAHLLFSLFARDTPGHAHGGAGAQQAHAQAVQHLQAATAAGGLVLLHHLELNPLPDRREHFGYKDGISQVRIAGVPDSGSPGPDVQPAAAVGDFLLGAGYPGPYGPPSLGRLNASLCQNACYAALRIMEQDCAAFDRLLDQGSARTGLAREWVAGKLMGRMRDGTPLNAPVSAQVPQHSDHNSYDYAPSPAHPQVADDHAGLVCPVGAHARRMNPRNARVVGLPHSRRILRRGLPYGPAWQPGVNDAAARGLAGLFLCGDLERQFEFMQQSWANGDHATPGLRGTQDPIIGAQELGPKPGLGGHRIPMPAGQDVVLEVPRLVTTRGSLYLLVPGLGGIRFLSQLSPAGAQKTAPAPAPDAGKAAAKRADKPAAQAKPLITVKEALRLAPEHWHTRCLQTGSFNPRDPEFLANPYPHYRLFRAMAPVMPVSHGPYRSHWVFTHALVTAAAGGTDPAVPNAFVKRDPPGGELIPGTDQDPPRGLFYMDPPAHTAARQHFDGQLSRSFGDRATQYEQAGETARRWAQEACERLRKEKAPFDAISRYAHWVTRNNFLELMGVPNPPLQGGVPAWEAVGTLSKRMLYGFDEMLSPDTLAEALRAGGALTQVLRGLGKAACPAHAAAPGQGGVAPSMFCGFFPAAPPAPDGQPKPVTRQQWEGMRTLMAHLNNFMLGGYLSTEFLVGNALHLLLARPDRMALYRSADAAGRRRMLAEIARFEAPFQMADRKVDPTRGPDASSGLPHITLGGVDIPAGEMVTLVYGSANHDAQAAAGGADPEALDWQRAGHFGGPNLVFGHGIHRCIGGGIAATVAQQALDTIADALPHSLRLAPDKPAVRLRNPYFRGFQSLYLQL